MTEPSKKDATLVELEAECSKDVNIVFETGGGDTTFFDYAETHPINNAAAGIKGGLKAAAISTVAVGSAALLSKGFSKDYNAKKIGMAIIAASTLMGAVVNTMRARTHNKWANDILDRLAPHSNASMQR